MICFKVQINDDLEVIAGKDDISVLDAIIGYLSKDNSIDITLRGLISKSDIDNEYLDWIKRRKLQVNDEIKIRIIDSETPDPPIHRKREDPKFVEEQQKKYFERMKSKFEKND